MEVVVIRGVVVILIICIRSGHVIVAQSRLWVHASVASKMRLVVRGSALVLHLLPVSASRFAATCFDHTAVMSIALSTNLALNIFVILVLSVLVLATVLRSFWLNHSVRRSIWLCVLDATSVTIALLEVIRESCPLSILMLLLQSCVVLIALTWDAGQLLLRLRDSRASLETWLPMLVLS